MAFSYLTVLWGSVTLAVHDNWIGQEPTGDELNLRPTRSQVQSPVSSVAGLLRHTRLLALVGLVQLDDQVDALAVHARELNGVDLEVSDGLNAREARVGDGPRDCGKELCRGSGVDPVLDRIEYRRLSDCSHR